MMVNGLHLYKVRHNIAWNSTVHANIYKHRRQSQPHKETASSSGALRVRRLAQGHLDTRLGGAVDRTSNLLSYQPTCITSWATASQ